MGVTNVSKQCQDGSLSAKATWARCTPEKPANANTMKKISANKTTGNFQVDTGPKERCPSADSPG